LQVSDNLLIYNNFEEEIMENVTYSEHCCPVDFTGEPFFHVKN
jgi:hypothetical protein